jgi:hypothetical protein
MRFHAGRYLEKSEILARLSAAVFQAGGNAGRLNAYIKKAGLRFWIPAFLIGAGFSCSG